MYSWALLVYITFIKELRFVILLNLYIKDYIVLYKYN